MKWAIQKNVYYYPKKYTNVKSITLGIFFWGGGSAESVDKNEIL